MLWQLLALHHVGVGTLRCGFVWERIDIPSLTPAGELIFRPLSKLGVIPFGVKSEKPFAPELDGNVVGIDTEMSVWKTSNQDGMVVQKIRELLVGMGTLELVRNEPVLAFIKPSNPEELTSSKLVFDHFDNRLAVIQFGVGLEGLLAAEAAEAVLNQRHPLVGWLAEQLEGTEENPKFAFLHSLAAALLEEGAMKALATGNFNERKHNWHFNLLGYYFKNVDLSEMEVSLRPPYQCWHPEHGRFEVTIETLESLAEVQAIDWHRNEEKRYL